MEETKQPIGQTIELARPIETDSIAKFNQMLSDVISKYGKFEWEIGCLAQADLQCLYETNPAYAETENIDSTQEVLAFFKKQIKDGKPIITCTRGGQRNGRSYLTLTLAGIATRIINSKTTISFDGLSLIKELKDNESYVIDEKLEIWRHDKKTSATEVEDISKLVKDRPINIHNGAPTIIDKPDYEFEPIAFSSKPEGWVKAIVYKDGNPIGRMCLPHPKFLLGEIAINIYEKKKDEFLKKLTERDIPKVEKVGTFKAKIFCVNKISKKNAGKVYAYGALTLQTPNLAKYIGKHVRMDLSVIQDESKTEKTEDITGSADDKVMPETTQIETPIEKQEPTKTALLVQDAKREVICEQCKHWQFGHDDYMCMKFQGDNGQNCVDMNFESFEQETKPAEETGKQIPQLGANAVKPRADVGMAPANDVGGASPPEAAISPETPKQITPEDKEQTKKDVMRLLSKGKFNDRDEAVLKITERLSAERGMDIDAKIVESLLP